MSTFEVDPRLIQQGAGLKGYWKAFIQRLKGGELGSLPVIIGLIVIWSVFQSQNSHFLTAQNLNNLTLQVAATGTIAVGIVLVLLLGEVDLSVGSVSGVTAALMAVLLTRHADHFNAVESIILALGFGLVIGLVHGVFFTKFGVPSFVVTLAGLIGWQGVQLRILGSQGTINLPDSKVTKLMSTYFGSLTGWIIAIVLSVAVVLSHVMQYRQRTKAGLRPKPIPEIILRSIVVIAGLVIAVSVFNHYRGVPLGIVIFVGFIIIFDLVLRHTTYGRHIFAVGGNAEAARRAGIRVGIIRMSVFSLAGMMAAAGGLLASSRLISVNQSSGSSDTLLNAIAAAVIGGTSLFGGRGSSYSALLGMLVIGSISNGLDLLGKSASTKFMITGAVLLLAVTLDSVARRGRQNAGR